MENPCRSCFAVETPAHRQRSSVGRSCSPRRAPGSWFWSQPGRRGASGIPAARIHALAARFFVRSAEPHALASPASGHQPLIGSVRALSWPGESKPAHARAIPKRQTVLQGSHPRQPVALSHDRLPSLSRSGSALGFAHFRAASFAPATARPISATSRPPPPRRKALFLPRQGLPRRHRSGRPRSHSASGH